ncbi:phospholipid-transporting ATPase ABCA1-like [Plodia interpunctella]|uniref:phospholipid-transporting ATPase ABCA1-like n=1 Tax=Plodia interpunctella TaxID=58824 RepID=UPI002368DF86|nr:phospholipid-transporting ATPase ABCA1-like [Plodia interpunctella]
MRSHNEANAWEKFRLMMWKNFLLQWRHPIQTAAELLVPVAFMAVVLLIRWQIEPRTIDVSQYPAGDPLNLNDSDTFLVLNEMDLERMSIAYSPKSEVLEDVVRKSVTKLLLENAEQLISFITTNPGDWNLPDIDWSAIDWAGTGLPPQVSEFLGSLVTIQAYSNSDELRGIYAEEEDIRRVIAAVQFDDELLGATILPNKISYALRFPERPRLNSFFLIGSRVWRTESVFPTFEVAGPRQRSSPSGGDDPGYFIEMFIQLQHVISTELISKVTGQDLSGFRVGFQRFPHPAFHEDFAIDIMQLLLPMFIMLTFSYTAINTTGAITGEKEMQLKETLKIMGVPTWIHWLSWFLKQFLFLLIASVLVVIIMKVNWFTNEEGFSDYAIFTHTHWTIILFLMALYCACTIFFCFMISGFFSKGSTAALFTGVIWFLTYIPATMVTVDDNSVGVLMTLSLSINTAMAYGFNLLMTAESLDGLSWGEFMTSHSDDSRLLFGHVVIMLVVDCVLYMLVALYLEQVLPGPFGTPKPWYFFVQKNFWCYNKVSQGEISIGTLEGSRVVMEQDPTTLNIGVKIKNLCKHYGLNTAVNNLSLNIYEDQITVLLGHNGAGKSTTISMLTGNIPISSGSIELAGYDVTHQTSEARRHLGLCPQHDVLFDELTVREHLEFFSSLKGSKGKELKWEVDMLIEKLELQEKRNYRAKGLSGGQKRRLCVGIALSGDARVVMLDEPTSGMDPSSRRALWDLLQKERHGRSMILTTHFMDEADILGDRVAIMAHGQLQCVGSPYFLKQHYGVGYTLVVVKDEGFDMVACTDILSKYIPAIAVKEDRGTELTYSLQSDLSHRFEDMLNDLERNVHVIKFKNYGLDPTTLEDVFLSVGSLTVSTGLDSDATSTATELSDFGRRQEHDIPFIERLDGADDKLTGIRLLWQHMRAIWIKLWLVKIRSWGLLLLQVLVPILQINLLLGMVEIVTSSSSNIHSRWLTLAEGYSNTESLLSFNGSEETSLGALAKAAYEYMVNNSGIDTMQVTVVDQPVDQYYLERASDYSEMSHMRHSVLTGATFSDDSVTAWFSNFAYHDFPTSMAAVHNALLKAYDAAAEINVYNHPLTATYRDQSEIQSMVSFIANQLSSSIGNSLGVASAVFVMFYIRERTSRAKLLQRAAGIQPITMWGAAALFDWLWLMIISISIVISCAAFGVIGMSTFAELGRMYFCIMVYGAAMLPLHYLASYLFQLPAVGFVVMYFASVIFGMTGPQIIEALEMAGNTTARVGEILGSILQFFPLYSLVAAIRSLNHIGLTEHSCLMACDYSPSLVNITECSMEVLCQNEFTHCCVRENPYFDWEEPGILRYLVAMIISFFVFWGILLTAEYRLIQKVFTRTRQPPMLDESTLDRDVLEEARSVRRADDNSHNLVARDISKYYGKHLAVNQVSFSVGDSECFGLLGVNGAGKTTTFKMLMGDESMSSGDAFVSGNSVKKNITQVHKNIGYCPQFDAVFPELTGRETLRVFALLRGLHEENIPTTTELLAHKLGFTQHLEKKVREYSGGNKRKLSTAVALLGRTKLVFVDEPTTGVDPAAKRQVWRAIQGAQRAGRGVVLTSHSMEECEALCTRLTIMVNGQFRCIGSPQHLKNKFSEGFTLTIKIKTNEASSPEATKRATEALKNYVNNNFDSPKLMEEYQGLLTYYLPDRSIAWSRLFGIMERAKRDQAVEDYSISQTTLEQIFLQFTKYSQQR